MTELLFLHSARQLMLVDTCIKFCEYSLRGFQVIERTQFVTDRQMDRRMPVEKQYVSRPWRGRPIDAQQTLVHQKGCYTCQWLDNVDMHLYAKFDQIYHVFPVL